MACKTKTVTNGKHVARSRKEMRYSIKSSLAGTSRKKTSKDLPQ